MIKILICCLGGFSSSTMSVKMSKEIDEKGYNDRVSINFLPFATASRGELDAYDVVMCCPHLKFDVSKFRKHILIVQHRFIYYPLKCMAQCVWKMSMKMR